MCVSCKFFDFRFDRGSSFSGGVNLAVSLLDKKGGKLHVLCSSDVWLSLIFLRSVKRENTREDEWRRGERA